MCGGCNYCTLETVHGVSFVVRHRIATKRYEDEKERQKKQAESIAKVKTTLKERGAAADGGAPMEAGFYEDDQDRRKRWVHCVWPINGKDWIICLGHALHDAETTTCNSYALH